MSHTPGPWRVTNYVNSNNPSLHIAAGEGADSWQVAQAISWAGDGADEAGYNAKLIAMAPEMLEFLATLQSLLSAKNIPLNRAGLLESVSVMISKATQ